MTAPCAVTGSTVDEFVACLNQTLGLEIPRATEIPVGSSLHALYALTISEFDSRPRFLYWGEIGTSWSPFDGPTKFTPQAVAVYLTSPQLNPAQDAVIQQEVSHERPALT